MEFRSTLMWIASLAICVGMLALSVIFATTGGYLGLLGYGLGGIAGFLRPGQTSVSERIGNAYVVSLFGLTVGFLIGGLAHAVITLWLPHATAAVTR